MKNKFIPVLLLLIKFASPFFVYAQDTSSSDKKNKDEGRMTIDITDDSIIFDETQYNKPSITFTEGPAASSITRIITQSNRSNFVYKHYMVGAFLELKTVNVKPVNTIIRIAGYYPVKYYFNKVEQIPVQTLLYSVDLMYGFDLENDMWKLFHINFAPALHFNYQLTDAYHFISVGGGFILGAELPVTKTWTLTINQISTFDYGNLGTNSSIAPINVQYQYQGEIGVRYSKKNKNPYSYIH